MSEDAVSAPEGWRSETADLGLFGREAGEQALGSGRRVDVPFRFGKLASLTSVGEQMDCQGLRLSQRARRAVALGEGKQLPYPANSALGRCRQGRC